MPEALNALSKLLAFGEVGLVGHFLETISGSSFMFIR